MKKYIVVGGWVTSATDGDRHWVSGLRVARLYRLRPDQYYLASGSVDAVFNSNYPDDCIILKPRYDGNYVLPEARD